MERKKIKTEEEILREKLIKSIFFSASLCDVIHKKDIKANRAENTEIVNRYLIMNGIVRKPLHQQNNKELEKTKAHFSDIFFKASNENAIRRSIELLTIWMDSWVSCEAYEKAQACKDYIESIKQNPVLAYEILDYGRQRRILQIFK